MDDAQKLAEYCRRVLNIEAAALSGEYGYQSLPLCIIDAVWSIGVKYEGVKNVVRRYCVHMSLPDPWGCYASGTVIRPHTLADFLNDIRQIGIERYTDEIFQNRQRTSTRSGILKSEAVYRFASVLERHGITKLHDVPKLAQNPRLDRDLKAIPGQTSGISLAYFPMLCGDENLVKPDRMVIAFLEGVLQKSITDGMAQSLLVSACFLLRDQNAALNPRLLDHEIWKHQRTINVQ